MHRYQFRAALGLAFLLLLHPVSAKDPVSLRTSEFVFQNAPHPQCHASTLAQTTVGKKKIMVAAWFGGTHERHKDVGIWIARRVGNKWSKPREVANGIESADLRYPCWNPVLHQHSDGTLQLYYKVGPSPREWWGMLINSKDGGQTWSKPARLPKNILGPIKNKPVSLGTSLLLAGSSTEHDGWRVHMEWTPDKGKSWSRTEALNDGKGFGAIQPTILRLGGDNLSILCRCRRGGRILQSFSSDRGKNWTPLKQTTLPNPNSGIDAVTLRNGIHLLVYNHTERGRSPLNLAISKNGRDWQAALQLEHIKGEFSYPAIIQGDNDLVHISYTYKRRYVKYLVIDPQTLRGRDFVGGSWPREK